MVMKLKSVLIGNMNALYDMSVEDGNSFALHGLLLTRLVTGIPYFTGAVSDLQMSFFT